MQNKFCSVFLFLVFATSALAADSDTSESVTYLVDEVLLETEASSVSIMTTSNAKFGSARDHQEATMAAKLELNKQLGEERFVTDDASNDIHTNLEAKTLPTEILPEAGLLALAMTSVKDATKLPLSDEATAAFLNAQDPVECALEIEGGSTTVDLNDQKLMVKFTVKNSNDAKFKFLKWETPFEAEFPLGNIFDVQTTDGTRLEFTGVEAKRSLPEDAKDDDFKTIPANGALSTTIDLSEAYPWTSGVYFITVGQPYDGHIKYKDTGLTRIKVDITAKRESRLLQEKKGSAQYGSDGEINSSGGIRSKGCSADQITAIKGMEDSARAWITRATKCQVDNGCQELVKKWFGKVDAAQYKFSVGDTMHSAMDKMDNTIYVCQSPMCKSNVYAFVHATDTEQHVYMCDLCFDPSVQDTEKRQTVVHELSHFDFVGAQMKDEKQIGERDYGYGESKCEALAKENPMKAMDNADSVGYFVRDVGLGVDPTCTDRYPGATQCDDWVKRQNSDCNKKSISVGGEYLSQICRKTCGAVSTGTAESNAGCRPKEFKLDWKMAKLEKGMTKKDDSACMELATDSIKVIMDDVKEDKEILAGFAGENCADVDTATTLANEAKTTLSNAEASATASNDAAAKANNAQVDIAPILLSDINPDKSCMQVIAQDAGYIKAKSAKEEADKAKIAADAALKDAATLASDLQNAANAAQDQCYCTLNKAWTAIQKNLPLKQKEYLKARKMACLLKGTDLSDITCGNDLPDITKPAELDDFTDTDQCQ